MTGRLRATVIGLGVGEQHARAYLADPRVELASVFDIDPPRRQRVAADLGVPEAESFEAAIDGADVVSIASYDADHAGEVLACLSAGKHVFVEKPLCRTSDELAAIGRAWRATGVKLSSNLILRRAPLYEDLRRRIADGELGEIYAFDGDYLFGRLEKILQGWRGREAGYSALHGGGVHLVDLLLWLVGQRPTKISGHGGKVVTRGAAFAGDDLVSVSMSTEEGLIARVSTHLGCVHRHQHVVRIFGTEGTFIYDDAGARLHRTRDPAQPSEPLPTPPLPANKGDLIPGFIDAIVEDRDLTDHTHAMFDVVSICSAGVRAIATGEQIEIEYWRSDEAVRT